MYGDTVVLVSPVKRQENLKEIKIFRKINQLLGLCKDFGVFCATCREGELYLLVDDLHGDEVVFLVEAAVVEQQTVGLPGRKTGEKKEKNFNSLFVYLKEQRWLIINCN